LINAFEMWQQQPDLQRADARAGCCHSMLLLTRTIGRDDSTNAASRGG
jgi:hypothetical protein